LGDTVFEPDETFSVNLSGAINAAVASGRGTGLILNDDPAPVPSIRSDERRVGEGDAGSVGATFTVTIAAASGPAVTVSYATASGSATARSDYTATSAAHTIQVGQDSRPVSVPILGDTVFEPDETFSVNLSGAINAAVASGRGTGLILNDDPAPVPSI